MISAGVKVFISKENKFLINCRELYAVEEQQLLVYIANIILHYLEFGGFFGPCLGMCPYS